MNGINRNEDKKTITVHCPDCGEELTITLKKYICFAPNGIGFCKRCGKTIVVTDIRDFHTKEKGEEIIKITFEKVVGKVVE